MSASDQRPDPRSLRHRMLPEVGSAGQARVEARRLGPFEGDAAVGEVLGVYLERAGMVRDADAPPTRLPTPAEVDALAGAPALREAAAYLAGAFHAVEQIKQAVGAGRAAALPEDLCLDDL